MVYRKTVKLWETLLDRNKNRLTLTSGRCDKILANQFILSCNITYSDIWMRRGSHGTYDRKEVLCKMNVKPLDDRVLITRTEKEEQTSGGIIIPDTAKEKSQEGKVVSVGPGKLDSDGKRIPMEVKKNDRILFSKYAGTDVKLDGVEHLILRQDDILAIIE